MNYRLHCNSDPDDLMDEVLCKKHLDAKLNNSSVGFNAFFKKNYTVTECNHPCEDCSQYNYESAISEG